MGLKWEKMKEGASVAAVALLLVGIWWSALPMWGGFFLAIALLLALFELISTLKTGNTLSQQFGDYLRENKGRGVALLISLAVAIGLLIYHLWKMQ